MRTKEEIIEDVTKIITDTSLKDSVAIPTILSGILIALLDIRDILENRLQDMAEPPKFTAND